ncbi:MAG TPA: triose-phosphate isomerase [Elusimicrobiota bacterium]|nr:triose-phosphate isomerase [Elusimicrobiota bacterium]
MARRPLIAGNWKMHKTVAESVELVQKLRESLSSVADRDILVAPPFTVLAVVAEVLKGSQITVGAQNMNDNVQGAFTGEVSGALLKDVGCSHVILGHSERRQYYGETDALVNKKLKLALDVGLTPIVCVGELLREREEGKTFTVIEKQVKESLGGLAPIQANKVVVAYEPVWAIGTGKTATPAQAQEVHSFIRKWIERLYGEPVASAVRILYGGSVKPDNMDSLMAEADIDGGLVGGASLKAEDFTRIVRYQAVLSARAR